MRPTALAAAVFAALLPSAARAGLVYDFVATDGSGITAELFTDVAPGGGAATIAGSDVTGFEVHGNPGSAYVPPPQPPFPAAGAIVTTADRSGLDSGSITWPLGSPGAVAASVTVRAGGLAYLDDNPSYDFSAAGVWSLDADVGDDAVAVPEPATLVGAIVALAAGALLRRRSA